MIDDAVNYTYVYDVFGRLKTVKTRGGSPLTVSEYTYNGLGHRIGWHYDADTDTDVDGSDPWYWFFYDERWRMVATYRAGDANPKERFVYHNAGANGYGGSSYIDSTILRDADDTAGWASAAPDSTLQTRYYYLQNWRADVVAMIEPDGDPIEYVRYSAYGVPVVYGAGDVNRDGVVDILDVYAWDDMYYYTTGDAAVDIDLNRDGSVDSDDYDLAYYQEAWGAWASSGRGFVSRLDSRKGYAGYELDPATTQWHVRHRVLVSEIGRWSQRDPVEYLDSINLYQSVKSNPWKFRDPTGLGCKVYATCRPAGSSTSDCCRTCRAVCLEDDVSRRVDTPGPCGCEDLVGTPYVRYREFEKCSICCIITGRGGPPGPEVCPGTVTDNFILDCRGVLPRDCDMATCKGACDDAQSAAEYGCDLIPNRVAREACKAGARAIGHLCRESCAVWCTQPKPTVSSSGLSQDIRVRVSGAGFSVAGNVGLGDAYCADSGEGDLGEW